MLTPCGNGCGGVFQWLASVFINRTIKGITIDIL